MFILFFVARMGAFKRSYYGSQELTGCNKTFAPTLFSVHSYGCIYNQQDSQ
uniref:Uncharacterized protein n=1 Tax=Helianthus annuus TaxID=4232 RepID=A0A251U2X2_HELAN